MPPAQPYYILSYNLSYMAVVSVRVDDETLHFLKAHEVNVSEVARAAFAQEVRRLRAKEALDRLSRLDLPAPGPSSEEIVRRSRDARYSRA